MAQTAHAYAYPRRERVVEVPERPRVRVVTGGSRRPSVETVPALFFAAAHITAAVLVAITLVGFARIALNTATVTMSLSTQEVNSELATARTEAASLEVQQSTLSNPTRIRTEAAELGMATASTTETISLSPDVVVIGEDGELGLASSIRLASQAAS